MSEYAIPYEQAIERLNVREEGDEQVVHTFMNPSASILVGADWTLDDVKALIEAHGAQTSGDVAKSMGHELVVMEPVGGEDRFRPIFIETKPERSTDEIYERDKRESDALMTEARAES